MKNKKNTRNLIFIIVALVGILIITRGITYAKYASNAVLNYYLTSKGFYFSSDELSQNTKKNVDTTWDGESIHFSLLNSANDSLNTEYDIKYKVTCAVEGDSNKLCYLNGTTSSLVNATLAAYAGCTNKTNDKVDVSEYDEKTCKEKGYTWESQQTKADLYFDVVDLEGKDVETATVIITATSTSPYEKTLSAKYIISKDKSKLGSLSLTYEEKDYYENLIVTNSYNEDKCVKLTWNPESLVIDLENDEVKSKQDENNYTNEIIFKLEKKNSKNFTFYKNDSTKSYKEDDFTLVESTECE